ncbi:hypothetical protein OG429_39995 [Streptomyces sp. NBC_00190]|uniref:hypothetical protein n=1 Tax=unclassified Streptomyces TaxID=2593676 RepID=UPI002E2986DA|nr:hypothetical protein [Streptomyces sp. NBC_00190]WSZ37564.1 hypothetical protein OG239_00880 [Streptomyces sp. NBC_00868]
MRSADRSPSPSRHWESWRSRVDGDAFFGLALIAANLGGLALAIGGICDEVHDVAHAPLAPSAPNLPPPPP